MQTEFVVYKKFRCKELFCSSCGEAQFVRLSRIKDNYTCQKCSVILKNKRVKNHCKVCDVILDEKTEKVYSGKRVGVICSSCFKLQESRKRTEQKEKVIGLLGKKCACCGESHIEFLTVDHINNDGKVQRANNRKFSGDKFYKWILKNWPDLDYDLQLLCWNCNEAKQIYGKCPHKGSNFAPKN